MEGAKYAADEELNTTAETIVYSLNGSTRNPMVQLLLNFRFWWYVTVIPFGLLGNLGLLCLLVVCRKQNRALSCSMYMGALAIADSVVLLCQAALLLVNSQPSGLSHATLTSTVLCKIGSYASYSAAFGGVLIILALLLERVIAVTRPLKAALLLSPMRAVVITVIIVIIASIYNVPVYTHTDFIVQCGTSPGAGLFYTIYPLSKLFFHGLLPFLGILIMNIMILRSVKSHGKMNKRHRARIHLVTYTASSGSNLKSDTSVDDGMLNLGINDGNRKGRSLEKAVGEEGRVNLGMKRDNLQRKRERQLTLMTVLMSIMFLCLTMPKYAHQLAFTKINWQRSEDKYVTSDFAWSASISSQLFLLNSAINFYLYVMAGTKFRSDLVKMLRCRPSNGF